MEGSVAKIKVSPEVKSRFETPKIKVYKKLYFKSVLGESHPSQPHGRVAKLWASPEEEPNFRAELEARLQRYQDDDILRGCTPIYMNAGVQKKPQTAACFVGKLEDSLVSIFGMDRDAGMIYASGSGIGVNYGNLRETNCRLSKGGRSSGPFAFMRKSASTILAVKSGGETRRAAHMGMMYDHHPDVVEFIEYKARDDYQGDLEGMNLSVAISDAFMQSVADDLPWELRGVVDKEVKRTIMASDMFERIAKSAHKCGCPGVWFIDRANRDNGLIKIGRIESTNPCGEQGLLPYQNCALAHINVRKMVEAPGTNKAFFSWTKFRETIRDVVRALDNMIDVSGYPTPDYRDMALKTRPIGLGFMGFADALIAMGIPYDSDEAVAFAEEMSRFMSRQAWLMSAELARDRGAFPAYVECEEDMLRVVAQYFDLSDPAQAEEFECIKTNKLRNSNTTTIAPTGTTSISAGCSQGMEPLFAIYYDKKIADSDGEIWTFVDPQFEALYSHEPWYEEALKEIKKNHGSCRGCHSVPEEVQSLFRVAHDISWPRRIQMQAALQRGITNSISSTINLPEETPWETIRDIYFEAWRHGLKGVTVYRDGAKPNQPVSFGAADQNKPKKSGRPKFLSGGTHKVKTGYGSFYLSVNRDDGKVVEMFANGGKEGEKLSADIHAICRVISVSLQAQTHEERFRRIVDTLHGITDLEMPIVWDTLTDDDEKPVQIKSVYDAISKVLSLYLPKHEQEEIQNVKPKGVDLCPECGDKLEHSEGCLVCKPCAFSKCG